MQSRTKRDSSLPLTLRSKILYFKPKLKYHQHYSTNHEPITVGLNPELLNPKPKYLSTLPFINSSHTSLNTKFSFYSLFSIFTDAINMSGSRVVRNTVIVLREFIKPKTSTSLKCSTYEDLLTLKPPLPLLSN